MSGRQLAQGDLPGPTSLRGRIQAVRRLFADPTTALDTLSDRYGRTFKIEFGATRLVVVGSHSLVGEILAADETSYRWSVAFRSITVVTGETGMLVSDAEHHGRRRQPAQPAFARRRLDLWAPVVAREIDRAIERLRPGDVVDLYDVLRDVVRRIVLEVVFGDSPPACRDEICRTLEPALGFPGLPALAQVQPFPIGDRRRAMISRRRTDRVIDDELARRRSGGAAFGENGDDVLGGLLAGGADTLSDEEIRDQAVTIFAAGEDTTSAAVTWALLRSLTDPSVWDRLRAEAVEVLDDPVDAAKLTRLPWASAVVRESLRLDPPGPLAARETRVPISLGSVRIPKRSFVMWSPYLVGRDPEVYTEPDRFRPERFAGGAEQPPQYAWIPFGAGPRKCIGFALAQMEMTCALARLAQRVSLEPAFASAPRPGGLVVSRPVGGLPVRVRSRT